MFDRDLFKALIGEIADTREVEIGCDECFEQLDRFVEMKLSGLNAAQAMPPVQEHVEICGECRFTTWAQKICVRTAFAEMRRSRWRDVSLDEVISQPEEIAAADPQLDPERAATQTVIMEKFRRFIDEELTDRQRTALLAALGGMPLEAVADRMNTNRNALYKLLHDARKRLRRRMSAEMLSPQDVLGAFGEG